MTRTRAWTAAVAAGCLLLVVAAWLLAIAPQRAQAADLRSQAAQAQSANDLTRLRTQQLKAAFAELPARQAELTVIARQMPATPQLAPLVRTLTTMAASAGVQLRSVTPTQPATAVAGAVPAQQTSGVTTMPTALVVAGDYASVTLFLQKLQSAAPSATGTTMGRAYLVQSFTVSPDGAATAAASTTTGQVQLTIQGQFFMLAGPLPTLTTTPAR